MRRFFRGGLELSRAARSASARAMKKIERSTRPISHRVLMRVWAQEGRDLAKVTDRGSEPQHLVPVFLDEPEIERASDH
jgi:hypothetical protein